MSRAELMKQGSEGTSFKQPSEARSSDEIPSSATIYG